MCRPSGLYQTVAQNSHVVTICLGECCTVGFRSVHVCKARSIPWLLMMMMTTGTRHGNARRTEDDRDPHLAHPATRSSLPSKPTDKTCTHSSLDNEGKISKAACSCPLVVCWFSTNCNNPWCACPCGRHPSSIGLLFLLLVASSETNNRCHKVGRTVHQWG